MTDQMWVAQIDADGTGGRWGMMTESELSVHRWPDQIFVAWRGRWFGPLDAPTSHYAYQIIRPRTRTDPWTLYLLTRRQRRRLGIE